MGPRCVSARSGPGLAAPPRLRAARRRGYGRAMEKTRIGITVALLALLAAPALAQSPLNEKGSMRDNLAALLAAKKRVTVVLKNGERYQAPIGAVGDHLVVLTGPAEKEFFDVLVAIDEIAALEVRARDR